MNAYLIRAAYSWGNAGKTSEYLVIAKDEATAQKLVTREIGDYRISSMEIVRSVSTVTGFEVTRTH